MIRAKSFLFGATAGLFAISAGHAADLPLKAKAVEYVKVCSLYGAGFFYIPGTDTCIKLGGYLRADLTVHGAAQNGPYWNGNGGANDRLANQYIARSRLAFTVDTRTSTEYGVVRTFAQADWQFTTGTDLAPASGTFGLENAFVQFAGFTIGKSASAYSTPWNGTPGNNSTSLIGGNDTSTGVNNIQYTWQFGNGLSTSLGVDAGDVYDRTNLGNVLTAAGGSSITAAGIPANAYAGQRAPDIVGRIRLDQVWGLLQFSAAAHNVTAGYYNATNETSGHPTDKWGFAVQGALQLKNLPTGPGDDIKIDASYAQGATRYVVATSGSTPNFLMFGSGDGGAYQSVGFGYTSDGIFSGNGNPLTNTGIELTTAWGIRGAYAHNWNANWQTSIFGSYTVVDYNGNATALYCAQYKVTVPGAYTCNPDFSVYQIGSRTTWTPVKNLTLSAEVLYAHLGQNFEGSANYAGFGGSLAKPAATYSFGDQGTVSVNFRAQRNF
ncbi:MAG: porin [Afipia sp.]